VRSSASSVTITTPANVHVQTFQMICRTPEFAGYVTALAVHRPNERMQIVASFAIPV
jgi:hypothetical protein